MSGRICLDTNVVIRIFRNDPLAPAFLEKYSRSAPVVGELLFAAKNSARARENLSVYSQNDLWIAAVCMEHNLSLATADRHFDNVEGLGIYSWAVE